MKCVCGYKYEEKWNEEKKCSLPIIGDDAFINVDTKCTVRTDGYHQRDVNIYVCPKCGTLKIDENEL
jgi:hypothetical protein